MILMDLLGGNGDLLPDEMIDFLCSCTQRVYRVTGKDAQYWVREHYMEGF